VRGLSQGDHEIKFDYEFNEGRFRIREARVMRKGLTATLYAVKYEYGQDGRLAKVTTPTGQQVSITYDQEKVVVAAR
jgi:YD repeat-containing protein